MTENADVGWLRETFGGYIPPEFNAFATREVYFMQMRRILAHIDELEADLREARNEWESARERAECCKELLYDHRPTLHEIAAQIMAVMASHPAGTYRSVESAARIAYDAAEALIAEGKRRRGEGE